MPELPQGIHFTVEVPFPNDCACYKVVRTGSDGRRKIIAAAQTREAADALAARALDEESDWYALSNGLESGQPR